MTRTLIAIFLAALSTVSVAQPAARGDPVYPVAEWPHDCWPSKAGDRWLVATAESAYGWIHAWWCADGTHRTVVRAKASVVDPLEAAYLTTAVLKGLDALGRPTVPVWRVAPNGTYATRPTYVLAEKTVEGVVQRSLQASTFRVAIKSADGAGTLCDCATRHDAGSTTYCAVPLDALTPTGVTVARPVAVCRIQ